MNEVLLKVKDLQVHFPVRKGVLGKEVASVKAVDGVNFEVFRGETLCLVGESGSGKTTTGRAILRLIEPTGGQVFFENVDVATLDKTNLRDMRKRMQIIFQDPYGSLNPRMTVEAVLDEILKTHKLGDKQERRKRIAELLGLVGLPPEAASRYPHEFSGGQRQRIGIARALAVEPDLIIADEPISALDVSIQAQILNLLKELQQKLGLTYLFIGHDLSVIRHIADRVAVMYLGKIVELGPVKAVFENTTHPYTSALLASVPQADPRKRREHIPLPGEIPSPLNPPSGCAFHPRCPDAVAACAKQPQRLIEVDPDHWVACGVHAPANEPEGNASPVCYMDEPLT